jgi:hypothetical protein
MVFFLFEYGKYKVRINYICNCAKKINENNLSMYLDQDTFTCYAACFLYGF